MVLVVMTDKTDTMREREELIEGLSEAIESVVQQMEADGASRQTTIILLKETLVGQHQGFILGYIDREKYAKDMDKKHPDVATLIREDMDPEDIMLVALVPPIISVHQITLVSTNTPTKTKPDKLN